jgi:hypothetical protein
MGPTSPATNISGFTALATGERDCISIDDDSTGYIYRGEIGC